MMGYKIPSVEKFGDMFSRLDTIPTRMSQIDGQIPRYAYA